jgi:hypothetical protein
LHIVPNQELTTHIPIFPNQELTTHVHIVPNQELTTHVPIVPNEELTTHVSMKVSIVLCFSFIVLTALLNDVQTARVRTGLETQARHSPS